MLSDCQGRNAVSRTAEKPVIFNEEFQKELSFSQNWVAIVGSALSQSATPPS